MRIAIISDIHGNLPALEAVLADVVEQQPDAVYCLGDLVGYGASPNEVTDRIRAEGIATIMGNYDDGVGFDRDECGCAYRDPVDQELGDRSLAWTKTHDDTREQSISPHAAERAAFRGQRQARAAGAREPAEDE